MSDDGPEVIKETTAPTYHRSFGMYKRMETTKYRKDTPLTRKWKRRHQEIPPLATRVREREHDYRSFMSTWEDRRQQYLAHVEIRPVFVRNWLSSEHRRQKLRAIDAFGRIVYFSGKEARREGGYVRFVDAPEPPPFSTEHCRRQIESACLEFLGAAYIREAISGALKGEFASETDALRASINAYFSAVDYALTLISHIIKHGTDVYPGRIEEATVDLAGFVARTISIPHNPRLGTALREENADDPISVLFAQLPAAVYQVVKTAQSQLSAGAIRNAAVNTIAGPERQAERRAIAHTLAANAPRRAEPGVDRTSPTHDMPDFEVQELARDDLRRRARAGGVSDADFGLFVLHHECDFTFEELARMSTPPRTATALKTRVWRIRKRLRDAYSNLG